MGSVTTGRLISAAKARSTRDFCCRGHVNDQVIAGDIPQEPPGFQPRARLLAELNRSEGPVSVVHGANGMRGVGKTQLAAAYARDRTR